MKIKYKIIKQQSYTIYFSQIQFSNHIDIKNKIEKKPSQFKINVQISLSFKSPLIIKKYIANFKYKKI